MKANLTFLSALPVGRIRLYLSQRDGSLPVCNVIKRLIVQSFLCDGTSLAFRLIYRQKRSFESGHLFINKKKFRVQIVLM